LAGATCLPKRQVQPRKKRIPTKGPRLGYGAKSKVTLTFRHQPLVGAFNHEPMSVRLDIHPQPSLRCGRGWHPMEPARDSRLLRHPSPAPQTGRGTHAQHKTWACHPPNRKAFPTLCFAKDGAPAGVEPAPHAPHRTGHPNRPTFLPRRRSAWRPYGRAAWRWLVRRSRRWRERGGPCR